MKTKIITTILLIATAFSILITGCKSLPSTDQIEKTSRGIGIAAGFVVSQTKIDAETRDAIIETMETVVKVIPEQDQTFEETWTPIAKEIVAKLVADGKLKEKQEVFVLAAFNIVTKALDYEFTVRYPKAREVTDLVSAAINGFTDGFLTTFNMGSAFSAAPAEMDKDAYKYLITK